MTIDTDPIQHTSMTDAVASRLRRMILSRELEPGQRIRQAELADMLGVSTMPVREALLRLIADGMVVGESNRSFAVADTTEASVRDIYWIHASLSGELTARAWDHRTDTLIAELDARHREYKRALKTAERSSLSDVNWQFHAALNRAADSPAIVRALRNTLHYFPDFSFDVRGWNELAGRWQAGVLTQLRTGTREEAREVVTAHVRKAAELFIQSFWSDAPPPTATNGRASSTKGK